jgi:hypothetical protein
VLLTRIPASDKAEKGEKPPLDLSWPVYLESRAEVCPDAIFTDPRADRGLRALNDAYTSIFSREEKFRKLGCEIFSEGQVFWGARMAPPNEHYVRLSIVKNEFSSFFTRDFNLKN